MQRRNLEGPAAWQGVSLANQWTVPDLPDRCVWRRFSLDRAVIR